MLFFLIFRTITKNPPFVTFQCFSAKDRGEISRLCGGFGGHINSFWLRANKKLSLKIPPKKANNLVGFEGSMQGFPRRQREGQDRTSEKKKKKRMGENSKFRYLEKENSKFRFVCMIERLFEVPLSYPYLFINL